MMQTVEDVETALIAAARRKFPEALEYRRVTSDMVELLDDAMPFAAVVARLGGPVTDDPFIYAPLDTPLADIEGADL